MDLWLKPTAKPLDLLLESTTTKLHTCDKYSNNFTTTYPFPRVLEGI